MIRVSWMVATCWLLYAVAALAEGPAHTNLAPATDLPISQLQVSVSSGAKTHQCSRQADLGIHRCSDDVWHFVGAYAGRANGVPIKCLWSHPPKNAETMIMDFNEVELAHEVTAVLALMPGSRSGATVRAKITIDGKFVATLSTSDERKVATLSKTVPAAKAKRKLSIEISAKNNNWRLACLQIHGAYPRALLRAKTALLSHLPR